MIDDPTVAGAYGSYFFDDEGQPATPTQILRDGVLVAPLTDLISATLTRRSRSANGRRENYERKSYARMSNTFFGRGTAPPADLLASLEHGIYLPPSQYEAMFLSTAHAPKDIAYTKTALSEFGVSV